MRHWGIVWILVLSLFSSVASSQGGDSSDSSEQRKRLIEQKLRLVESLVNSPAAQTSADGREAEVSALLLTGRKLLDRVRRALVANQLDEAGAAIDEALRNATKASARLSNKQGALSTSVQQANYKSLSEQVATYQSAIDDLSKLGNNEARAIAGRINVLRADAGKQAEAGKLGDANRNLADAYKLAVESIAKLREGQTVTLTLNFSTPAEEYDYERRRFLSSEILVDMMLAEGRAEEARRNILPGFDNVTGEGLPVGGRRSMVDGLIREARQQLGLAAEQAQSGDHRSAVALMEKATASLNRALQVMGVPIF